MKRRLPIVVLLLLALGGLAWWFGLAEQLGWARGENGKLTLYGNVDIREVQLGFRVNGRIAEMMVDEGDSIAQGAVLARLDRRPFEDSRHAAEAQVAAQQANLSKMRAGPRDTEIAQARATVAEREAALANALQAFERTVRLNRTGTISQASLDQATAERDMARARLALGREALKLLLEGSRAEDIAAAKATFAGAEASLASAQTALDDADLRAPSSGVILSRVREPGAIVMMGDTVYVLSLTKPVWVRAYVDEPDLGRIHPGMEVAITSDTRPDAPYRGQIGFISPVAEFTPKTVQTPELRTDLVYRLRIVVSNADEGLRQGMPVTIHVSDPSTAKAD